MYTCWDVRPFADEVWVNSDNWLRYDIEKQWLQSACACGRVDPTPPDWLPLLYSLIPGSGQGSSQHTPTAGGEASLFQQLSLPGACPLPPFKWDPGRRAILQAELDAYFARLYGLTRKQLRYILDPADLTPKELKDILDPWEEVDDPLDPAGYEERCRKSDFPGETFRVLKEKEIRQYGEYRTRRLVLEAWQRLEESTQRERI
ncbi:MAG: hypothetical protein RMJ16_01890 [Thermoguttaceae bacterium]|nr:hypothetical protein [Thermoguttaceae bacterium]